MNHCKKISGYGKVIAVLYMLSIVLLCGCGKEETPSGAESGTVLEAQDQEDKRKTADESSTADETTENETAELESSSPSKLVMEQVLNEWNEMYSSFYQYRGYEAVLSERVVKDSTVEEIFMIDISYISNQSDTDEPEHYIADMKATYQEDKPEDITLWMDCSGGEMTDWTLFKECGPG